MRPLILALLCLCLTAKLPLMAQGMYFDWAAKWAGAREYTLAVAYAMPDSLYAWRPDYPVRDSATGELRPARTFGNQLVHLADNIRWLSASKLHDGERPERAEIDDTDKAAVRAYVEEAFDVGAEALHALRIGALDEQVEWFDGGRISRRRAGLLLFDHVTHHRAQAIVYMRMCGREAPGYVGW